jgi:hypothetical protein
MVVPPMMMMPVVVVPVMPVPVPVSVMATDLFGLETVDLVLRDDRGHGALSARRHQALFKRNRWERRSLRDDRKDCDAGGCSKSEFQKMAVFHDISSFACGE